MAADALEGVNPLVHLVCDADWVFPDRMWPAHFLLEDIKLQDFKKIAPRSV